MPAATRVRLDYLRPIPNFERSAAGGFDLYWSVTTLGGLSPTFMPEYSTEDPLAAWTPLLDDPTSNLFALAVAPRQPRLYVPWKFRVKVYDGVTLLLTSDPYDVGFGLNRHDYLHWREITRRLDLGFRKYQGIPGHLLRRKTTGPRCTECLDEVMDAEAKSDCPTCYGTGYLGGYHPPMPLLGDWESAPPSGYNMSVTENGPAEMHKAKLRAMANPSCEFKDIWVDASCNYRYEIQKIDLDEFRGVPTAQILDVSKLPASHAVYRFPIDLEP